MPDQYRPLNILMVLGFTVAASIPLSVMAVVQSQLAWYHGLATFYGILAAFEVFYLGLLLVSDRGQGGFPFRLLP